jgi:transmembrane sensor
MKPQESHAVPYSASQGREAAEWFVVIHSEDEPNPDTLQAWLRWLDQDEGNRVAFESVARAWHGTPEAVALSMPNAEELADDSFEGDIAVSDWLARKAAAREDSISSVGAHRGRYRRFPVRSWLAAASVVAMAVGLLTMHRFSSPPGSQADSFSTAAGEQIQITLADGSHVWLGPKSVLSVRFSPERRSIQLTSGEAFFSVKKDRSRPFVVGSASGDITAVGTAFNVRALHDHVTVTVSEGVVTVAPQEPATTAKPVAVRVASGQQVTFSADEAEGQLNVTQSATPGERSRWRDGILIYRNEPLRDVVMDVARYTSREFEIESDAVGDMRYSGVVYQGAVDEWATALPESFPVRIVTEGNRKIIQAR